MRRKATKQSRAANADEKAFMRYTKECNCIACGAHGPSEVDHCVGSSAKVKVNYVSVLIGHWWVIPLCPSCHRQKTSAKIMFINNYGDLKTLWAIHAAGYNRKIPEEIKGGICAY